MSTIRGGSPTIRRLLGPGWLRLALGAIVVGAVIIATLIVFRPESSLDDVRAAIGDDCPSYGLDHAVYLDIRLGDGPDPVCEAAARSAMIAAGVPADEVDDLLVDGASRRVGDLRVSAVRLEIPLAVTTGDPADADEILAAMLSIEIADCERTVVPTDPELWRDGIPTDRFWYSICDEPYEVRVEWDVDR